MVLVAGGTGVLGSAIVDRLVERGRRVRVLTRDPARAARWSPGRLDVVRGDLRDPASLQAACAGVAHVVATANAFMGRGAESVSAVDVQGTRHLIDASRSAGVQRFVFTSALLPEAYRAIDFFAAKFATEDYLRASGVPWTILRPAAFMETWAILIGEPLVSTGKTTIFGAGDVPSNFVAVANVADVAVLALDDPGAENAVVEIAGPENLTLSQVADTFERVTGKKGRRTHLPVWLMRALGAIAGPFNPVLARQIGAAALMASRPQPADPAAMLARYPVELITLEQWIRRRYAP